MGDVPPAPQVAMATDALHVQLVLLPKVFASGPYINGYTILLCGTPVLLRLEKKDHVQTSYLNH